MTTRTPSSGWLSRLAQGSLVKQILIGLVLGVLLALVSKPAAIAVGLLGTLFVGALKAVAPVLVLMLVMASIANHQHGQKTSIRPILFLYLLGTFSAALTAVLFSFLFPSTLHLTTAADSITPPSGIVEVLRGLLMSMVSNPIDALLNANYIGILVWAVGLGFALRHGNDTTKNLINDVSHAVTFIVKVVIRFAPLGIFGLVSSTLATTGFETLWGYAQLLLVLVGHAFRLLRWEQFIRIYERPPRGQMLRGMAGGYALNFVLPFHLGDAFRAVYTGRRMKSGIGFALATVIMDRFLDVWFVAFGFIAFRLLGLGGAPVDGAARYYLVFSLLLVLGLVLVVALRDFLKKICLAFCGLFNDTLKLDGMMFFWSLINTFKDLGRVKIGRLVVNTLLMWAAYLGSYTALAAALTVAGEPMQLVDVFGLLFGRNAADFAALLPGGALGTAAPAARWLLLAWFVLPLLAMWAATLLPEKVRGAVNQATQAAPAGESYLNLLPQADPQDRAAFLS